MMAGGIGSRRSEIEKVVDGLAEFVELTLVLEL